MAREHVFACAFFCLSAVLLSGCGGGGTDTTTKSPTRSSASTAAEDARHHSQKVTLNVNGGPLQTCSKPGMALTGFTRDVHCQDQGDDDAGSHHICIQMKSHLRNFRLPSVRLPPDDWLIDDWCVSQWAFATYIETAGGCDSIVELQCDATNMAAIKAYEASDNNQHQAALECIQEKCNMQAAQEQLVETQV